jgi:hypothetical protein
MLTSNTYFTAAYLLIYMMVEQLRDNLLMQHIIHTGFSQSPIAQSDLNVSRNEYNQSVILLSSCF